MEGKQKATGARVTKARELPQAAPAGGVREQNQFYQPFIFQYFIMGKNASSQDFLRGGSGLFLGKSK